MSDNKETKFRIVENRPGCFILKQEVRRKFPFLAERISWEVVTETRAGRGHCYNITKFFDSIESAEEYVKNLRETENFLPRVVKEI